MENYLSQWIKIIEEMKNDNTYKTAWGRGIIECAYLNEYSIEDDNVIMKQSDIALKMIKYYWNQTFFFGLSQGKNPVILKQVKVLIEYYKNEVDTYPKPWNEVEAFFYKDARLLKKVISKILSNARINVCPRFRNVKTGTLMIYEILDKERLLVFKQTDIATLKEYAFVLSKLLNYKWAQLLERFNLAPKISQKVNAASERKIKRSSLRKYKNLLLKYYHKEQVRDFYTGEVIDIKDIHIDHVIPWSFIYTNEIWNLVVTKSTTNMKKGNRPPTKVEIEKLKKRNSELMESIHDNHKLRKKIEYSLTHHSLEKLYINMKG
ncbi:MAG: HNH endonuclease domain-containing protein [Candidatus Izemoplasma sp.]|nr:HNH endonuclease domain-containing protein [Candidatus Izemoplasma sp.]